jgi:hypothetical protein
LEPLPLVSLEQSLDLSTDSDRCSIVIVIREGTGRYVTRIMDFPVSITGVSAPVDVTGLIRKLAGDTGVRIAGHIKRDEAFLVRPNIVSEGKRKKAQWKEERRFYRRK